MNNNPFKNISLFTIEESKKMINAKELEKLNSTIFSNNVSNDGFVWVKSLILSVDPRLIVSRPYGIVSIIDSGDSKIDIQPVRLNKLGCPLFKIDFDEVKNSPYLYNIDGTNKYTLGEFPQNEVKNSKLVEQLYEKFNNNTLTKTGKVYSFIRKRYGLTSFEKYDYDEYQLDRNKYILYENKWYKVEPIIWRYSISTNSLYNLNSIIPAMTFKTLELYLNEEIFTNNFTPSNFIIKNKTVKFSELKHKLNNNTRYINLNLIIDKNLTHKDVKDFYKEYSKLIDNLNIISASKSIKALFFLLQTYTINITFDKYENKDITEEKEQHINEDIKDINDLINEIKIIANKLNIIDKSIILIKIEELINNYNSDINSIKKSIISISNKIELSTTPKDSQALKQNLIIELNNILSLLNRKLLLNPLLDELNNIKLNIQLEETELSNLVSNIKLFINNLDTNNKKIYTNELNNIIDKYYNNISSEINLDIYSNIKLNLTNIDYKSELMEELNSFYKSLKENKKLSILGSLSKFNKLLDGDTKLSNTLYIDGGYLNTIELTLIDIYNLSNKLDDNLKKEKINQITNICNKYLELISNNNIIEEIIKLENELLSILTKDLLLLKMYFIKNGSNIDNNIIDTSIIRK